MSSIHRPFLLALVALVATTVYAQSSGVENVSTDTHRFDLFDDDDLFESDDDFENIFTNDTKKAINDDVSNVTNDVAKSITGGVVRAIRHTGKSIEKTTIGLPMGSTIRLPLSLLSL
jgi:hypothetical protein